MNKIVIFFSHAGDNYVVGDNGANYITNIEVGNTKIVADYISEITGADQYDGMAYTPLPSSSAATLGWAPTSRCWPVSPSERTPSSPPAAL